MLWLIGDPGERLDRGDEGLEVAGSAARRFSRATFWRGLHQHTQAHKEEKVRTPSSYISAVWKDGQHATCESSGIMQHGGGLDCCCGKQLERLQTQAQATVLWWPTMESRTMGDFEIRDQRLEPLHPHDQRQQKSNNTSTTTRRQEEGSSRLGSRQLRARPQEPHQDRSPRQRSHN